MIWIILLSVLCTAAVLEYFSIRYAMKRLQLEFRTDLALSEPGETVTLSFTIRNTSRFPQLYISASVYFEDGLRICESEDFMAKYVEKNAANIFKRRYISFRIRRSRKKSASVRRSAAFFMWAGVIWNAGIFWA